MTKGRQDARGGTCWSSFSFNLRPQSPQSPQSPQGFPSTKVVLQQNITSVSSSKPYVISYGDSLAELSSVGELAVKPATFE